MQCAKAGLSHAHLQLAYLAGSDEKLFLTHYKGAMKNDRKLVNSLELTTVARDSLNKIFSEAKIRLKKFSKEVYFNN